MVLGGKGVGVILFLFQQRREGGPREEEREETMEGPSGYLGEGHSHLLYRVIFTTVVPVRYPPQCYV